SAPWADAGASSAPAEPARLAVERLRRQAPRSRQPPDPHRRGAALPARHARPGLRGGHALRGARDLGRRGDGGGAGAPGPRPPARAGGADALRRRRRLREPLRGRAVGHLPAPRALGRVVTESPPRPAIRVARAPVSPATPPRSRNAGCSAGSPPARTPPSARRCGRWPARRAARPCKSRALVSPRIVLLTGPSAGPSGL